MLLRLLCRSICKQVDISEFQRSRHSLRMMQNDVIMSFKVIQGHRRRYQSKARMQLPISDYWLIMTYILYRFEVVADYCSNFGRKWLFAFWAPFGRRLRAKLRCPSYRLSGEYVVDFLFVLTELFFASMMLPLRRYEPDSIGYIHQQQILHG